MADEILIEMANINQLNKRNKSENGFLMSTCYRPLQLLLIWLSLWSNGQKLIAHIIS